MKIPKIVAFLLLLLVPLGACGDGESDNTLDLMGSDEIVTQIAANDAKLMENDATLMQNDVELKNKMASLELRVMLLESSMQTILQQGLELQIMHMEHLRDYHDEEGLDEIIKFGRDSLELLRHLEEDLTLSDNPDLWGRNDGPDLPPLEFLETIIGPPLIEREVDEILAEPESGIATPELEDEKKVNS